MATPTLAEAITASFYAWEVRGRGWTWSPFPVSLEPPFRPFFLLPEFVTPRPVDDGRRPPFRSRIVEAAKAAFRGEGAGAPVPPFEEPAPFPASAPESLRHIEVLVPREHKAKPAVTAQLLRALGSALYPVAFEVIGTAAGVRIQVTCAAEDAEAVLAQIEGYLLDATVVPSEDLLDEAFAPGDSPHVLELGLSEEFFLPLKDGGSFTIDPFVPLLAAVGRVARHEALALQVLFERTRNPWGRAAADALDDGDGGCLIEDAPWFLPMAKEKLASPLYAVSVRLVSRAEDSARSEILLRGCAAFVSQFARPGGNELVPLRPNDDAHDDPLDDVLRRVSHRTGMLLSEDELVGLLHLPDTSVAHPLLARGRGRTVPLPAVATGHALVLGDHEHRGVREEVSLDLTSRFAHTWVIGGSGTGKSTLLARMILSDIEAGHGAVVLDPHGELIDDIVARVPVDRAEDVILFDPTDTERPVGLNVLQAQTEIERDLLGSDLVSIFRRYATSWGDSMSTVLGNAVLALLQRPEESTLLDLKRFLVNDAARTGMLGTVSDPEVRAFWQEEYPVIGARSIGPLLTRLDGFLRSRIVRGVVGQRGGPSVLHAVFKERKVLLARLAKGQIGEENAFLLGSLLLSKVNQYALMRQAVPKEERHPVFVYADEGQHYVTPSLEALAAEGRKYRVGIVFAHQALSQLSEVRRIEGALLANCHTRIVFRVGDEDAAALAKGFAHFEASDLTALGRGEAVIRIGGAATDLNLATRALPDVLEEVALCRQNAARDATRRRYGGIPIVSVAELVQATPSQTPVSQAPSVVWESAPDVEAAPLSERSPKRPARTGSAPKAAEPTPGRGGSVHKYLQHLVKRLAEERGFRATIEGAAANGQADLVLVRDDLRIACEISVTTDTSHEIGNITKCLEAGFSRVLFLSPERRVREKVAKAVTELSSAVPIDIAAPEEVCDVLDKLPQAMLTRETTVKGYTVKVKRVNLSADEAAAKRGMVAAVVARSVARGVI